LAEKKMEAAIKASTDRIPGWLLTADTIVAINDRKLGKPGSIDDAREFLLIMSGQTHQVITGLAMYSETKGLTCDSAVTQVRFSSLSDRELEWYLSTDEWKGVAAGYRIQGIASRFIPSISGSYSNVMGLPIHTFYGMLRVHGYPQI